MMSGETLFGEEVAPVRRRVSEEDILTVWGWWLSTFHVRGRVPLLSPLRRRRIHDAIRDYGVRDVKAAISGCTKSEWHMGRNPGGKKYTDVSLILRDPEHIERFLGLWEEAVAKQRTTEGW